MLGGGEVEGVARERRMEEYRLNFNIPIDLQDKYVTPIYF